MNILPLVTVIVPCRNEEKFIAKCLASIIALDYPRESLEVIVVDGLSNDSTRCIIYDFVKSHNFVKLFDNPNRVTPFALNIGIKNATGEFVVWMSAHNEYSRDHIRKCIKYMREFNADAVGGVIRTIPRVDTFIGRVICNVLSHKFGVGDSSHKIGSTNPVWADTAFGVCYKRELFDKVGLFNERLSRGQDMEFAMRLKRAGYKTLLCPDIVSFYYARSDLKSFIRHNFLNGIWAIYPFKLSKYIPVSFRHLVPLFFVLTLMILFILTVIAAILGLASLAVVISILLFFVCAAYLILAIYYSMQNAIKYAALGYLFAMPLIFLVLHLSYGLGSFWGLVTLWRLKIH